MIDTFSVTQFIKLLHAPICIYSADGELVQALEDIEGKRIIEKEDFKVEPAKDFPYVNVAENGVAFGLLWLHENNFWLGLGKVRIYEFGDEAARQYSYCRKDDFAAIITILWRMHTGQKIGIGQLWERNIGTDYSLEERITKELFEMQEEGVRHNPYSLEIREQDCIRRGDIEGLRRSMDEVYSGRLGILARDEMRQYKNIAIGVITMASRSAIEGGLNPEQAFSMADTLIWNIEENLTEPVKIEKAMREAELEFTRLVQSMRQKHSDNPMVEQIKDYVFCHIHDPIRVKEIAEHIGVTPNYLSEQFSQEMGMPLKQYIIEEKLISSENLLKYTDYSLQEISSFCAFSSQSRFCVYFQRKNGITPARYRKQFKRTEN